MIPPLALASRPSFPEIGSMWWEIWWDKVMGLTSLQVRNAVPGMHADGNGLYLCVKPSGSKSWILRFQMSHKRREMGLGAVSVLSLADARAEAARLKVMIAQGINPIEGRREAIAAQSEIRLAEAQARTRRAATFKVAAAEYIADQEAGWRNAKHRQQWSNTLKTYAYPTIGDLPVGDITAEHIIKVLRPIWSEKPETASRVRMRIEAVLNSAKLKGWRSGENPAIWRGGLEVALPRISKVKRVRHHPAMPWQDVSGFWIDLANRDGISPRALQFTILTASRSGEVRGATWSEIDLADGVWIIPSERMKAGREHRVPLSAAALTVLQRLPRIKGCDLVFPGSFKQPLSDMTLAAVLKRMGLGQFTVHGFRSTFRDWAAENTNHSPEVVEMALAHTVANKVEAAYRRGDLLAKRKVLMDDWTAYLNSGGVAVHDQG